MKKLFNKFVAATSLALTVALSASLAATPAFAETLTNDSGTPWNVVFTGSSRMETNFNSADIAQLMNNMQPGDTAKIEINVKNENSGTTNWYMTNKIIQSMEDAVESAQGGAYGYDLTYEGPTGTTTTLFSSETVGGDETADGRQGLNEISGAMDEYFLLGQLDHGQSGLVQLAVTLDGETQGNSYQNTLADLSMDFAVELNPQAGQRNITSTASLLQTGDEFMNQMYIYIGIAALGLIVLIIAIIARRKAKKNEQGVQQ